MDAIVVRAKKRGKPGVTRKRRRKMAVVWIAVLAYMSSVAVAAVIAEWLVQKIHGRSLIEVFFGSP